MSAHLLNRSYCEPKTTSPPPCPPRYWPLTTYTVGDTIEHGEQIYQCQASPYEKYCNVINLDKDWSDSEKQLWQDAWVYTSDCEKLEDEEDMKEVDIIGTVDEETASPTALVTKVCLIHQ